MNKIFKYIEEPKIPIIILTDNINILNNQNKKNLKKLDIQILINDDVNEYKDYIIYYYTLILYLNIQLWNIKNDNLINSYEQLKNKFENLEININDINCKIIKYFLDISQYFSYKFYFEYDAINNAVNEFLINIKDKIKNDKINTYDIKDMVEYIYNFIFYSIKENNYINDNLIIKELAEIYDLNSFYDVITNKIEYFSENEFEKKIIFDIENNNYINKENLIIEELLNIDNNFQCKNKKFSINYFNDINNDIIKDTNINAILDNKLINSILTQSQILINNIENTFISLYNIGEYINAYIYIYTFIKKNKKSKLKHYINNIQKFIDNYTIIIKAHNKNNIIKRINTKYFINDKAYFNYGNNYSLINNINGRKSLYNII